MSIILLICLAVLSSLYVFFYKDELSAIVKIRQPYIYLQFVLATFFLASNGVITRVFAALFRINLVFKEWFGLSVLTAMANYLTPFRGGASVKAIYLKRRRGFPYSTFLSTLAANYIILIITASILGCLVSELISFTHETFAWKIPLFFIAVGAMTILFLFFSPVVPASNNRMLRILRNILEGWDRIRKDRALVLKVAGILTLNYFLIGMQLIFAYRAFSIQVPFLPVFLMGILSGFSIFLSITPGNLGIQEAIIATLSELMGIGFSSGLIAAGLIRAVNIILVFSLGPVFSYLLMREKANY